MNRQQRIEWLQKIPPEKLRVAYFIRNLFCLWSLVAFYLFMSGEAIFILPAFFLGCVLSLLRIYFSKTMVMQGTLTYADWSLCLAFFSYLSTADAIMRPFFSILCLLFGFHILVNCWRKPSFFPAIHICIWLMCIAVAFFFGFWPVGLIVISVSVVLSLVNEMTSLYLVRFKGGKFVLMGRKAVRKGRMTAKRFIEISQKEMQMPKPTFASQVPGQQYQPLLPEYDSSFGPYIQDLPRE